MKYSSSIPTVYLCMFQDAPIERNLAVADYGQASSSLHRWNDEFRSALGARRPARRDRLCLGVEADRVRPMLIEVTEAGALPTAEGVVGEGHRNREVHADHADLDATR